MMHSSPSASIVLPACAAAAAGAVVLIERVVVLSMPGLTVSFAGAKVHVLCAGSPEHVKLTIPERPALAMIASFAVPVWPGVTVMEAELEPMEKSGAVAVTVIVLEAVLGWKFSSPLYSNVIVCVPAASPLASSLPAPFASGLLPSTVVPSRKVPVPVGTGRPLSVGATCAVIVDEAEASVTTVPPRFITSAAPEPGIPAIRLCALSPRKLPAAR
jgi:hypothetical protein